MQIVCNNPWIIYSSDKSQLGLTKLFNCGWSLLVKKGFLANNSNSDGLSRFHHSFTTRHSLHQGSVTPDNGTRRSKVAKTSFNLC